MSQGTQHIGCGIIVCSGKKLEMTFMFSTGKSQINIHPFTIIKNKNELIRPTCEDMNESKKCNSE